MKRKIVRGVQTFFMKLRNGVPPYICWILGGHDFYKAEYLRPNIVKGFVQITEDVCFVCGHSKNYKEI
jgi:hypothetical protein